MSSPEKEKGLEIDYEKTHSPTENDLGQDKMLTTHESTSFFHLGSNLESPPPRKKLHTANDEGHDTLQEALEFLCKRSANKISRKMSCVAHSLKLQIPTFPEIKFESLLEFWKNLTFNVNYDYNKETEHVTITVTPQTQMFEVVLSNDRKNFPKSLAVHFYRFSFKKERPLQHSISSWESWHTILNPEEEGQCASRVSFFLEFLDNLDPLVFLLEECRVEGSKKKKLYVLIAKTLKFAGTVLECLLGTLESNAKNIQYFRMNKVRESLIEFVFKTESAKFDEELVDSLNRKDFDDEELYFQFGRIGKEQETPVLAAHGKNEKKIDIDPIFSNHVRDGGISDNQLADNALDIDDPGHRRVQFSDIYNESSLKENKLHNLAAEHSVHDEEEEGKVSVQAFTLAGGFKQSFHQNDDYATNLLAQTPSFDNFKDSHQMGVYIDNENGFILDKD